MTLLRRTIYGLIGCVLLSVIVGSGYLLLNRPAGGVIQTQLIDIPPGTSFTQASLILHQNNLIDPKWFFQLLGRVQGVDRKIIPGEYELNAGMRPTEVLNKLVNGEVYQHLLTIPEGLNVVQIADLLDQKGLARKEDILRLNRDQDFIQSMTVEAPSLEGYLFPDTYRISRYTPPESIMKTFVTRFHEMVTPDLKVRAELLGMTFQEALTLASVIEKETGLAIERPLVSGVFHNRLQMGIPLQSDPTVIYAIEFFDGNIRKSDLAIDSPYNTYKVRGLPPGPIANPGLAAIQAALYPAQTDYVYFVARNDGSHHFSVTLADHNKAVDKYQRQPHVKHAS